MYEQSIEKGAFFSRKKVFVFFKKKLAKITFKHHLSEMYLLHEKAQPLSFYCAQQHASFLLICRVIEERRWHISKDMITLTTIYNPERVTSTVHTQNMITFSTVISYFHIISLMCVFQ